MKKKKLPQNKLGGLFVYCSDCNKYFSFLYRNVKLDSGNTVRREALCGRTKRNYSSCKSIDKHKYKIRVHVPGTQGGKISRTLSSETYDEAIAEAIQTKKDLLLGIAKTNQAETQKDRSPYLIEAEVTYLDYIQNIDVPEHKKKKRGIKHIKDVQSGLRKFNEALARHKINKKIVLFSSIGEKHVGYFHNYLRNVKGHSPRTYNRIMGYLKTFFKWAIKHYKLQLENPFEEVTSLAVTSTVNTISSTEFRTLLDKIIPENGIAYEGKKKVFKRNRYRPWLKTAFRLALHSGGRREEVISMKWNMIRFINGEPAYFEVPNLKVERAKGEGFNENVPPKIIPITKSLLDLLFELGYRDNVNKDQYVLEIGRDKVSDLGLMEMLSKGFSHFYNQLDTGKELKFSDLRNTYLTYLNLVMGGDTRKLSSHASEEVLERHYIDKTVISKAIRNFEIFEH